MKTEIRRTQSADAETAYGLTKELMIHHNALDIFTLTCERFKEMLENRELYSFIAYDDNQPIGVMNFFFKVTTFTGRKILYIEDLFVREASRRKSVGRLFIEKAKSIAKELDCEEIELKCAEWNENSAALYEKNNFTNDKSWKIFTLDNTKF